MMSLIIWEANESQEPADPEERMKFIMSNLERVKESVDSGDLKMWGMTPGGRSGFAVAEGDAKKIFSFIATWIPAIKFEVKEMLSVDETIDVLKNIQQ